MSELTLRPLSRTEVRSIDARAAEEFGLPTVVLMENAGRGAAGVIRERLTPPGLSLPRILILCGPGNNGGDGGVVARHLDLWGYPVRVVWFAEPEKLRGDAAVQRRVLERSGLEQCFWQNEPNSDRSGLDALLAEADIVVDGLLGTGLTRPVEGILFLLIEAINRSAKPTLALDLPSGLDADSGLPLGTAVRATYTATFVAPKLGFSAPAAASYTGEVVVVDIGAPRSLLEQFRS